MLLLAQELYPFVVAQLVLFRFRILEINSEPALLGPRDFEMVKGQMDPLPPRYNPELQVNGT